MICLNSFIFLLPSTRFPLMTKDEYDACIYNTELENEILEGVMEAQNQFNIKSTPSFIINGNLIEGNKSIKEFRQIIDKILSQ